MARYFSYVNSKEKNKWVCGLDKHLADLVDLPKRATSGSAGYDIQSPMDFTLEPKQQITIPTFIKVCMNEGEVLMIYPRSGLGCKYYTRLANTTGVIDKDYFANPENDGHILIKIRNEGFKTLTIKKGQAIAQGIFIPFLLTDNDKIEDVQRTGGFGSTDKE